MTTTARFDPDWHSEVSFTVDELTVLSDVLRRADGVGGLGYFTEKPEFQTALRKIEDAKQSSYDTAPTIPVDL